MKDFMTELKKTLLSDFNTSVTENGALGYRTTGSDLLDLNFAVSSLRNLPDCQVVEKFKKSFFQNKLLAIKWLFFASDVRLGLGERRLFRLCYKFLAESEPNLALALMPLVAEYTRYDNLLTLLDTPLAKEVSNYLKETLLSDKAKMEKGEPISLCAKWMPSVNTSSLQTRNYAKILIANWGISPRNYRKLLSSLRGYTNVVEVKMSAGEWDKIDYSQVPSKANLKYSKAFMRNDEDRRKEFLEKLTLGTTKINAGVLYPHDIVSKYLVRIKLHAHDKTLEELWKALPDYVNGQSNTLCVLDGSSSMYWGKVGNTNLNSLQIASALTIYFAERSSGAYKDKFITFSENPQLVDLSSGKSLHDKLGITLSHTEVANTNIEKVFDLILATAINNKASQEDMPSNVLILSDMEFDGCSCASSCSLQNKGASNKLFKMFEALYAHYGYKLPRLVFWNICSRTGTIPLNENENGVALVSGFSPTVMDMVLSSKLDPYECLLDKLNDARYDAVQKAVIDLL